MVMFVTREILRTALSGGGFFQHFSLEPADTPGKPKLSYVMKVGQDWVLGAGRDGANKEDPFVRVGGDPGVREDLRSFVEEAIAFARERGREAALAEFNDRNGRFVRGNRSIFAYDYQGTTLSLPFQPQLLGTSLSHLQDAFGVRTNWIQCLLAKQGGIHLPPLPQPGTRYGH
jgi:polar amino acid transport system substrate-binding protein